MAQDEKFRDLPDLLLIDGGKGQLNFAREALRELGLEYIPTIGLAKEFEHIFVEGKDDPIILHRDSEALYLLQRIRDEAHRFAITYHRNLRTKRNLTSMLDEIPGIGKVRRKSLLNTFGSIQAIKSASVEELSKAPGMNGKAAQAVYEYFHKRNGN